ncbi:MAG: RNA-binding S4 domain-containing protein [Clostridia bacterium]|nr:RNA-binding S4 domain-containing protein [Clostridia bacterium]
MKIKVTVKQAPKPKKTVPVVITTENIRLDNALKYASAVGTGGQAKWVIQDELVKVNGEVCTARGRKLHEGDEFEFERVVYKIQK